MLNGSSTLVNTIRTYSSLRSTHLLGVTLMLLWAISPIGGQSPLHAIKQDPVSSSSTTEVNYFNTSSSGDETFSGADMAGELSPASEAVYTTAILAPQTVKQSSVDLWGNVKIPSLRSLAAPPNTTGWVNIPDGTTGDYSALIGIPIANLPKQEGIVTFRLRSTYFDLILSDVASREITIPFSLNGTGFAASYTPTFPGPYVIESGVLYVISNMGYNSLSFAMYQIYVESAVTYSITSSIQHTCRVTAMRNITTSPPVPFSSTQWGGTTMMNLITYFNSGASASNSLSEAYLRNPLDPLSIDMTQTFNSSTLEARKQLCTRFAQLFNTYAFSSIDAVGIMQASSSYNITTTAHFVYPEPTPVTTINWVWLTIFAAAVFVLLLAGLATLILHAMTLNPEVLGFASTATWRSQYISVPKTGSFLDGEQRAKLLRDVVVRLGDVRGDDPSGGKLGIGTMDRTVEVVPGRFYQ